MKMPNGYRCYTDENLLDLSNIMYSRKMGIGLDEIEKMWKQESSCSSMVEIITKRLWEESYVLEEHQRILLRLRMTKKECEKMNRNFNKISLRSFPSSYVLRSNDSTQQCMEEWCRLSNRFLGLDMSYIYNEYYFTDHSGKGMVQKKSHLLLSRLLESYIPSSFELTGYPVLDHGICAYTVIGTQKDVPDCGSMEKLFDWADRKCIRLEGTIYSSVRMQMVQDGQKHYYMELYMPICDSSGIPLGKV